MYLSKQHEEQSTHQHEELVKTANLLFGTLEQCYIWSYASRLLQSSCSRDSSDDRHSVQPVGAGPSHFLEMCCLTSFLLEMLSTDSSTETQAEHLPSLLLRTAELLRDSCGTVESRLTSAGIDLCLCLLKRIQPAHEAEDWNGTWAKSDSEEVEICSEEFHSPPRAWSPALISSSQHQKHLMEQTMCAVQHLLAKLLNPGIFLGNRSVVLERAAQMLAIEKSPDSNPTLEELMEGCVNPHVLRCNIMKMTNDLPTHSNSGVWAQVDLEVAEETQLKEAEALMKKSCLLLKELSSFPTYCAATETCDQVVIDDKGWSSLPDWLQLLCLSCCCLRNPNSLLDLTATSSLLDFTALTFSTTPISFWRPEKRRQHQQTLEAANDVFAVVLLPVISPSHLLTVLNSSRVLQILARRLWEGVGQPSTQMQCTELLHQLHTLSPPLLENVAEDEVLDNLNREMQQEERNTGAAERFTILWHLGRDLEPSRYFFVNEFNQVILIFNAIFLFYI